MGSCSLCGSLRVPETVINAYVTMASAPGGVYTVGFEIKLLLSLLWSVFGVQKEWCVILHTTMCTIYQLFGNKLHTFEIVYKNMLTDLYVPCSALHLIMKGTECWIKCTSYDTVRIAYSLCSALCVRKKPLDIYVSTVYTVYCILYRV